MKQSTNKHQRQSLLSSFKNAFWGIGVAILKERNIKIHLSVMILVCSMGILVKISIIEWCLCIILFGMVISAELINCAIEAVVDLVTQERQPLAKLAKDTAAGAVLICAISAASIGLIIFLPKLIQLFS